MNDENIYAGFWIRAGASSIDTAIIFISMLVVYVSGVLLSMIGTFVSSLFIANPLSVNYIMLAIIMVITPWIYYLYFAASSWQATPGKRLFGIYIINTDGSKPSFSKLAGRYLIGYGISSILCIGYIMAAFMPKKKALHDIMFNTYVVHGKVN